jgi:hypothetical protein
MPETYDSSLRSAEGTDPTIKWCLFFSLLILIAGSITYSICQISDGEDQLADLTRAVNQLAPEVKQSNYERDKLYNLAGDILRLSQSDRNAAQIVAEYKIRGTSLTQAAPDANPEP